LVGGTGNDIERAEGGPHYSERIRWGTRKNFWRSVRQKSKSSHKGGSIGKVVWVKKKREKAHIRKTARKRDDSKSRERSKKGEKKISPKLEG